MGAKGGSIALAQVDFCLADYGTRTSTSTLAQGAESETTSTATARATTGSSSRGWRGQDRGSPRYLAGYQAWGRRRGDGNDGVLGPRRRPPFDTTTDHFDGRSGPSGSDLSRSYPILVSPACSRRARIL